MSNEHFDVLIVGAGLSGIGAAYRLQTECPGKTYAILEGRKAMGGTWDLFRYPGIRSDSDMFTLGYPFRPWKETKAIAEGPSILQYIHDTADEYGIEKHIRYDHKVAGASWDSATARWTVDVTTGSGEDSPGEATYTCDFLYMCSGYYSYEGGYMPEFPGSDRFRGQIIHPQFWPEDLDYEGKKVVIIGSGATAVTLLPAMAATAGHVTMLQRSPTYIASLPAVDPIAVALGKVIPDRLNQRISRWKSVIMTLAFYQFCRKRPKAAKKFLQRAIARQLPAGYDIKPNFDPSYNPWDQRMCLVPDGDMFEVIKAGKASVVTGHIETFTETGIHLVSGEDLEADIIISATGLKLIPVGGISLIVDGSAVLPAETYVYRGCMLSDVPNFAMCVGYTNASWTLRADLSSRYVCKVIDYMDDKGYVRAIPRHREQTGSSSPLLDLKSGYVNRAAGILPKQGANRPWKLRQNYVLDYLDFKNSDVTESMEFARPFEDESAAPGQETEAALA